MRFVEGQLLFNQRSLLILPLIVTLSGAVSCGSGLSPEIRDRARALDYYDSGNFKNSAPTEAQSVGKVLKIIARMSTKDQSQTVPVAPIPINLLTPELLNSLSKDDLHLIKLGHSSLLFKIYGEYWLIDPILSERASPVSFAGPRRFHPPPITADALPPIDRVLISHDHYDHLDKSSIMALASGTTRFLVPLGVEVHLQKWGIAPELIESFEWWQELKTEQALVAFTPAQHFSGRTLADRDKTLWGSWVVKTKTASLFFSGDTGYFSGFKTIGNKYGPFDLTFIETGAYACEWPDIHLQPEQSVQAHIDLQGITMVPIHNGTFDLAFHPWKEPLERVSNEAETRGVQLITPLVGQTFTVENPPASNEWWRSVE